MRNKYLVVAFVLVISVIFASLYYLNNMPDYKVNLQYITECIDGRKCIEAVDEFSVGNNEKELHNGYYDFKVFNTQNGITIVINKLWYEQFNEMLYEQEYIEELCMYISKIVFNGTKVKLGKDDLDVLYKNLIEAYTNAKKNIQYENERVINNIKFTFYTENYELVLNMEVI